jgi:adenine-specific DNA-methyltransferase
VEKRLTLNWWNKHLRLLANDDGTYEWVEPTDFRVSEVRLLHNVATVGDAHSDRQRAKDNLVIRGDALHALTSLLRIPEFAAEYEGKVRLIYIDPPFNTGQTFAQYDDGLEHSVWLSMLRDRLQQIKKLLAPNGSVWVHLDDVEAHRARVVLDEVFGAELFVANIVWEKTRGARNDTSISSSHDHILIYAKEKKTWAAKRNLLPRSKAAQARYQNPDNDPRGPWRQGHTGTAKSSSEGTTFPITLPSGRVVRPPKGSGWRFSRATFDQALAEGRVYFGAKGDSMPVIKSYLTEVADGVVPRTWWPAQEVGSNQEAKRDHLRRMFPDLEPFATPKPERLMERIIHIATDPGDIVVDCFGGSGTTAAVAHKMGRRWVTVEWEAATVADFLVPRLTKVVNDEDPGGITSVETEAPARDDLPEGFETDDAKAGVRALKVLVDEEHELAEGVDPAALQAAMKVLRAAGKTTKTTETRWEGGGGFRVLDVAPSVYEVDEGTVLLADALSAGALAESVAAQLGFTYEPNGVFIGTKGRMRLAVIDGLVGEDVVRFLAERLEEKERVTVVATAVEPGAEDVLRKLRPGSRVRKVPRDLARLSSRRSEVVQLVLDGVGEA